MPNPENKEFPVPFDEVGNMILTKPEKKSEKSPKLETLEKEFDKLTNGKTSFICQYCDKEWDKKRSKSQHERWCIKNPNQRSYYKKTESVKKTKTVKKPKEKAQIKWKTANALKKKVIIIQENSFTVKELREIDKVFGLTDKQIIEYIRGIKRGIKNVNNN